MVIEALVSASVAMGKSGILEAFFYRDLPFVTHHVIQLINHPANASFPSDHATAAFASAVWHSRLKDGFNWLVIAPGIAVSRIWTGVHYPSDVVAGALIGFISAVMVHRLFALAFFLEAHEFWNWHL